MTLNDLNNPRNITGIMLWQRGQAIAVESSEDTAFQEYPGSIELWGTVHNGRNILRIKRWLKKSIIHLAFQDDPCWRSI